MQRRTPSYKEKLRRRLSRVPQATEPIGAETLRGSSHSLPQRPSWRPPVVIFQALLLTTLAIVPAPFAGRAGPVPATPVPAIALRTWTDGQRLPLVGQDTQFGEPGQPKTYEQQNPQRGRPPILTWGVLGSLSTPDAPFSQDDWPLPRAAARLVPTWIYGLLPGPLSIEAPAPFVQAEWPNPRNVSRPLLPIRFTAPGLTGPDTFFGAPGQTTPYDWPNPRLAPPAISLRTWTDSRVLDTLAIQPRPFVQGDWPNPRAAARPLVPIRWTTSGLASSDTFFGLPGQTKTYDWPNPRAPIPAISLRTWIDNRLLDTLAVLPTRPFAPVDWPNPRQPARPLLAIRWTASGLSGADTFFGEPGETKTYDWPNPRGPVPAVALRTWLQSHLLDTLGVVQPRPFALLDWPVPRSPVPATVLRTWLDPVRLALLGRDTFFGAPGQGPVYAWPLPTRARPALVVGPSPSLLETTLGAIQRPFLALVWPNPQTPVVRVALRTWVDVLGILTPAPPLQAGLIFVTREGGLIVRAIDEGGHITGEQQP